MIDSNAARSVADSLAQTGATIATATSRIRRFVPDSANLRLVERSVAWWEEIGADLKRRAAGIKPVPRPAVGPEWIQGPPHPRQTDSPTEAVAFFARLSPLQAMRLAERFPAQVGPVDGAPLAVRYRANHLLAVQHLEDLQRRRWALIGQGDGSRPIADDRWDLARWAVAPFRRPGEQLTELDRQIADAQRWTDEDRQFLLFDPTGDGMIIEAFGELESSRHVAIVVPGVGNGIKNYEIGFRGYATALYGNADRPDATVIAWLGYDTPNDLVAATDRHPDQAAGSLAKFLTGLETAVDHRIHTSAIAHSYGSLVTGEALRAGAVLDEVVFIGSPGVGVDHVSQLGLPASTRVWAGRAASDPIQLAWDIECLDFVPVCYPSADRLFFGRDPTDPAFGATQFAVEDAPLREAHSSYFRSDSVSLRNLTSIFLGQDHRVSE